MKTRILSNICFRIHFLDMGVGSCTRNDVFLDMMKKIEWIDVTDRLPEPMVDVLVYCISFGGENTTFEKYGGYCAIDRLLPVGFRTDTFFNSKVTHWMDLPDPPYDDFLDYVNRLRQDTK